MDNHSFFHSLNLRCKEPVFALACAFLAGLIGGLLLSASAGITPDHAALAATNGRITAIGLLSVIGLPLCFSAFAVYISRSRLVIPIAFCKAFLFSYTGSSILVAFGSAGWLIFLLLMFSDILMLPALWWYWKLALEGRAKASLTGLVPVSVAGILIGSLDYHVIGPFLANLLNL